MAVWGKEGKEIERCQKTADMSDIQWASGGQGCWGFTGRLSGGSETKDAVVGGGEPPGPAYRRCERHPAGSTVAGSVPPQHQRPQPGAGPQSLPGAGATPSRIWAGGRTLG